MTTIRRKVETALFKRCFTLAEIRLIVALQLGLAVLATVLALSLGWLFSPLWPFAAGVVLVTVNFYSLAKLAQRLITRQEGALMRLLVGFYARLGFSGLALFALIVWARVSIPALVAGLSTVLATILVWGILQMIGNNAKEA